MRDQPSGETRVPFPNIDPIAFAIGPFAVRWYALGYLFGVLLGAAYGYLLLANERLWHKGTPPFKAPDIWDFAFWAMLSIVLGGRLGYVLFYNAPYYAQNPLEILNTLDGGMSYHGGMLGLMLAAILFTRAKGGNWLSSLDLIAAVATIGIFLVRITNFINSELYGAPTDLPWGVIFPTDPLQVARHPSQLYEAALEGLVLFIVIRLATNVFFALRKPGMVAGIFGVGYGLSRILVEFVRLPDAHIGYLFGDWLTMGQVLSLPLVLGGLALIAYAQTRRDSRIQL
ncbi:MAG: prolipoprotein diacylglyceryl transferase [Devosia sp.]|nr:prolipoprotein diacylglyceryl transferase [Devosia sp.]